MNKDKNQNRHGSKFTRLIKKFFLSAFVVITFAAYALHKPFTSAAGSASLATQPSSGLVSQPTTTAAGQLTPTSLPDTGLAQDPAATATQPPVAASLTPPPAASLTPLPPTATPLQAAGQYKNGNYTGDQVDAFYGLVQVQVTIQNGKIANVQVPEYPNDRRTSVRINTIAVPYLQQEAIQAQDPNNVDIITGATLTSQAFIMSLQSALNKAKS